MTDSLFDVKRQVPSGFYSFSTGYPYCFEMSFMIGLYPITRILVTCYFREFGFLRTIMKLSRTVSITDDSDFQASRAHAKGMVSSERMTKRGRTDFLTDWKGIFTIYLLILRLKYIFEKLVYHFSRSVPFLWNIRCFFKRRNLSFERHTDLKPQRGSCYLFFFTGTKFVTYVHRFPLYPSNESLSPLPKVLEIPWFHERLDTMSSIKN